MDVSRALLILRMSVDLLIMAWWPITVVALVAGVLGSLALVRSRRWASWQTLVVTGCFTISIILAPLLAGHFWEYYVLARKGIDPAEMIRLGRVSFDVVWSLFFVALAAAVALARGFRLPLAGLASFIALLGLGVAFVSDLALRGFMGPPP